METMKRQLELRDYQSPASDFIMDNDEVVLGVAPNGGKTEISIDVLCRYLNLHPKARVLILTHSTIVLKDNYTERLDGLELPFVYSTSFNEDCQVHVCLPNNERHIKGHYDLLIVDEAHENYLADRIQRIVKRITPKKKLLLTGTPSKFIKKGGYKIYTIAANAIPSKYFSKLQVELVASSYNWVNEFNIDYEVKKNYVFKTKETEETLENILLKLIDRLKKGLTAEEFNNPGLIAKFKSWAYTYKTLGKTIIVCRSIKQSADVNEILIRNGVNCMVSDSKTDKESLEIINFKQNKYDVLVVVDRARLGYSDDGLYNIIDMSGTHSPNIIYQMFSRVLRGTPDMQKYYLKVTTQEYGMMDYTHACVSAALMLTDNKYLSTFNGDNFNGIKVPVLKKTSKQRPLNGSGNKPKKKKFIFPEFTNDVIDMFRSVIHNLEEPISIYKMTTIGDVREYFINKTFWTEENIMETITNDNDKPYKSLSDWRKSNVHAYDWARKREGLIETICNKYGWEFIKTQKISHSKDRTLEIARNYVGLGFRKDYPKEYDHAHSQNYIKELNEILPKRERMSKQKTLEVAKKYTGSKFSADFKSEYTHAVTNKYLPELRDALPKKKDLKEEILNFAKEYDGTNFADNFPSKYSYMTSMGYLDELNKALKHKNVKHSKERTLEIAKNYKGTNFWVDFKEESRHASKHGYHNELRKIVGYIMTTHSKERTLEIAKNYGGSNFSGDYASEYGHAVKNNYLDKLREILPNKEISHSKERTLEIARNYKGSTFSTIYPVEYGHAIKNGYLDEVKSLLFVKRRNITKEIALEAARNYRGLNFSKDCKSEYGHARAHNYLDEIKTILNNKC